MLISSITIGDKIYAKSDADTVIINRQIIAASVLLILSFSIWNLQRKLFSGLMVIDSTVAIKKYISNN